MAKWGNAKTSSYGDKFSFADYAAVCNLSEEAKDTWLRIRFVGDLWPVRQLWFATKSEKTGGVNNWPRLVESFNPKTEEYIKLPKGERDWYKEFAEANGSNPSVSFWANAIIRDVQESKPAKAKLIPTPEEKKTGFKDIGSKTWTPVHVVFLNSMLAEAIQKLMEANMRKNAKTQERQVYPPDDPVYGFDIEIYYDSKTKKPDKWSVRIPDEDAEGGKGKVKLTPEEIDYPIWDLESIYDANLAAQKSRSALEDIASSLSRFVFTDRKTKQRVKTVVPPWLKEALSNVKGASDEDDEEDERPSKKKGAAAKGKASRPVLEDDDEDLDDEDDFFGGEEDDDEDAPPPPRKSAGKAAVSSKKKARPPVDDDDDLDDEDEDLDEEDDDAPPQARGRKAKPGVKKTTTAKPKKKPLVVDDAEGEDLDDGDEEESFAPPKKANRPLARPKLKARKDEIPF